MKQPRKKTDEIELRPDGWQRFEAAVDAAVRTGPIHNPKVKKRPAPKAATREAVRQKEG